MYSGTRTVSGFMSGPGVECPYQRYLELLWNKEEVLFFLVILQLPIISLGN